MVKSLYSLARIIPLRVLRFGHTNKASLSLCLIKSLLIALLYKHVIFCLYRVK